MEQEGGRRWLSPNVTVGRTVKKVGRKVKVVERRKAAETRRRRKVAESRRKVVERRSPRPNLEEVEEAKIVVKREEVSSPCYFTSPCHLIYIYIDDDVEEEVEEKLPLSKSDAEAMAAELRSMQGCVPQATLAVWHREKKLATIIGSRRKKLLGGKFDVTKQPVFSRYYEAVAVQVLEIIIQLESDDEEEEDPYYQYERGGFEFVIFDYCYSNMC